MDTIVAGEQFFWVGACLMSIQAAERALAHAIEVALPTAGVISFTSLEADQEKHRRQTLGQLVGQLNLRARIDPGIEEQLDSFIKRRNQFVHHFGATFDLGTTQGCSDAVAFCQQLTSDASNLAEVFYAVCFASYEQLAPLTNGRRGWIGRHCQSTFQNP
jgi:hypothetical protein